MSCLRSCSEVVEVMVTLREVVRQWCEGPGGPLSVTLGEKPTAVSVIAMEVARRTPSFPRKRESTITSIPLTGRRSVSDRILQLQGKGRGTIYRAPYEIGRLCRVERSNSTKGICRHSPHAETWPSVQPIPSIPLKRKSIPALLTTGKGSKERGTRPCFTSSRRCRSPFDKLRANGGSAIVAHGDFK